MAKKFLSPQPAQQTPRNGAPTIVSPMNNPRSGQAPIESMAQHTRKTEWKWTQPREEAAVQVAHDQLPDTQIAASVGINAATLYIWKSTPEFATRVEEHRAATRATIRAHGIAVVENRVARKQADWERLEAVRKARADHAQGDTEMLAQGGATGLIIRKQKMLRNGPLATLITEYSIDTSLLAELHRLEEAVASELGQRVEKREVSGDGAVTVVGFTVVPPVSREDTEGG